jgi:hypothetical protein
VRGTVERVDTRGVDVTYIEWRSDRQLLLAGHRGAETAVGVCEALSLAYSDIWVSKDITASGTYATVSGLNESGD